MAVRFRTVALATLPLVLLPAAPAPTPPALVVVITIDQLRGDYLGRWSNQWTGGFRRFLADGALFPNGRQDHAMTETAPGHATILSGRYPARTNIPFNSLGVGDTSVKLVAVGQAAGASPRRFKGTTLV